MYECAKDKKSPPRQFKWRQRPEDGILEITKGRQKTIVRIGHDKNGVFQAQINRLPLFSSEEGMENGEILRLSDYLSRVDGKSLSHLGNAEKAWVWISAVTDIPIELVMLAGESPGGISCTGNAPLGPPSVSRAEPLVYFDDGLPAFYGLENEPESGLTYLFEKILTSDHLPEEYGPDGGGSGAAKPKHKLVKTMSKYDPDIFRQTSKEQRVEILLETLKAMVILNRQEVAIRVADYLNNLRKKDGTFVMAKKIVVDDTPGEKGARIASCYSGQDRDVFFSSSRPLVYLSDEVSE